MEEISIEGIGGKKQMRHNFIFTREESLLKRKKPRFPAPLHLSPFSPSDRDRCVDSPALSARGPDLPCTTQDEAGLMGKFDT